MPKWTGCMTPILKQKKTGPRLHQNKGYKLASMCFHVESSQEKLLYPTDYTRMWLDGVPKDFIHNNLAENSSN